MASNACENEKQPKKYAQGVNKLQKRAKQMKLIIIKNSSPALRESTAAAKAINPSNKPTKGQSLSVLGLADPPSEKAAAQREESLC